MPPYVCKDCVGESVVSGEIARAGTRHTCFVCGSRKSRTISIEALADRVEPVYLNLVGQADEDVTIRDGQVIFGPVGELPSEIVNNLLEADDERLGQRLVGILSNRHPIDHQDPGPDPYDETSDTYAIREPTGDALHHNWNRFCDQLKHRRRFFLQDSKAVLDRILGPIVRGEWPPAGAVRQIGPGSDITHVYRGRKANDEAQQKAVFASRLKQLAAPEPGIAGPGRMNPAGIGLFYGAVDRETCVAELRTPVGGAAIVGRFEIIRPLRVLDLTGLEEAYEHLSYFAPDYVERKSYADFMRGFHQQVRRAVIPGREALEYLPTQVVAEYLWSQAEPQLDGMIFESAQISDGQNNLVLFPHAAIVEGADDEIRREVKFVSYSRPGDDDDEDAALEDKVYFNPAGQGAPEGAKDQIQDDDGFFANLLDGMHQAGPAASLRLGEGNVFRVKVEAIQYRNDATVVRFDEWGDWNF